MTPDLAARQRKHVLAWILSLAVLGLFAAAYIGVSPSLAHQHGDSLEYGHACEERGLRALWGNHPFGHVLQCGAFEVIRRLGYQGRALTVMKIMNGVAAAAAMAAFFVVMTTTVGAGLLRSLGWTVTLAATHGMWHFAGTAEVYGWATLFLIVAWGLTAWSFERPSAARSLVSGAAFGLATLTHQFNGVILTVATIGLLPLSSGCAGRQRRITLAIFAMTGALTTVVGYAALGMLATGSSSPDRIIGWLIGHGRDQRYGRSFELTGALQAVHAFAGTLFYGSRWLPQRILVINAVAMGSVLALVSVRWIRYLPRRSQTMALSCILACIVGWLLIVWWQPANGKFWLLTLPAFLIWGEIAFAGLKRGVVAHSDTRRTWLFDAVPLVTGLLLLVSTAGVMSLESQRDAKFEESLQTWVEHSGPDDVLIENDQLTAHLRFWARRPTLDLFRILQTSQTSGDPFAKLRDVIDETLRQGHTVWFSPGLSPYWTDDRLAGAGVTRQQVHEFFDQYRREGPLFSYQEVDGGEPRPVYRLLCGVK